MHSKTYAAPVGKVRWTRAELIAIGALLVGVGSFFINRSNWSDTSLDRRIDERVAIAQNRFADQIDKKLDGIQRETATTNKGVQDLRSDLSTLTGRVQGIDRDILALEQVSESADRQANELKTLGLVGIH